MGMWAYAGRQTGRYVLELAGAFLLAAAVAALSQAGARHGAGPYLSAVFARLNEIAHWQFGTSAMSSLPAASEIARALPVTFELVGPGLIVALVVGVPIGLLFGAGRYFRPVAPLIQVVTAIPVFCMALLALWLAHHFGWKISHAGSLQSWSTLMRDAGALEAIAIPALIVGASGAAAIQLALHRAVSGAMRQPFYENLRRMGLGGFEIDRAYLPPYALIGFFRSFGEIALSLLAADAVVEWMFGWPGAADLFIHSVALHDWNVAALVLLVFAGIVLTADFLGQLGARAIAGAAP
jgi:peptide/nickel transport system permease protein